MTMKLSVLAAFLCCLLLLTAMTTIMTACAWTPSLSLSKQQQQRSSSSSRLFSTSSSSAKAKTLSTSTSSSSSSDDDEDSDPILIKAARGLKTKRTPVWMMRQAGRHIQEYRELCKIHKTFRERSEIPDVAIEVSLQPWRNYQTDGCILFSDILTPLPGIGADFIIDEKLGPIMENPITNYDDMKSLHDLDPTKSTPFVGEALHGLREAVEGHDTAVLGFVGCPYTLATYLVEGKTSRDYLKIKQMMYKEPELLHSILSLLAKNIGNYANYQIEHGAQLIQIFDSWAGHLSPIDYDIFAAPYQKIVLDIIKKEHPDIPTVIYIKHSGALIERMAGTGVDVVSLDWTVDIQDGRNRINHGRKEIAGLDKPGGVQGNLDPAILYADYDTIKERTYDILQKGAGHGHVMNLGHGIEATTPEENAHYFIETVRNYRHE